MKKILKYISVVASVFILGCEVSKFDLQENPNLLSVENANPESLLNEVQYLFQKVVGGIILNTDDIMRYETMTGSYSETANTGALNTEWERYYEALNISRTIEALAVSDSNLLLHNAINKLLMGYLTVTMIDYVGDVPYSQAANPIEFQYPVLDDSVELYKMVLTDIDEAIVNIDAATFGVSDLFYGGDKVKWKAFANSFKLRLLIQTRLASSDLGITDLQGEINVLLGMDLIDTTSEDFMFFYSGVEEPESRHPYFSRAYNESGISQYIGNYFMYMLKDSKSIKDPRIRYYLYRQSNIDPFSGPPYLACQGDAAVDYCYVGEQYWGLDHGETRTGRGDNLYRTVYGGYPAGGAFDEDNFVSAPDTSAPTNDPNVTPNFRGEGILPVLNSFNLRFLMAESALTLGTNGDPVILLEEAVRASMNKVLNFKPVPNSFGATSIDVDNYVAEVINNYNTAGSDEEKLDVIITEYYLATFGNSIEAYNAYRRTGYPSNIQIPIDNDNPTFPRSFPYPTDAVLFNASIEQKSITEKIFWDKNPDGFIK